MNFASGVEDALENRVHPGPLLRGPAIPDTLSTAHRYNKIPFLFRLTLSPLSEPGMEFPAVTLYPYGAAATAMLRGMQYGCDNFFFFTSVLKLIVYR
jgi:hypothetical protein